MFGGGRRYGSVEPKVKYRVIPNHTRGSIMNMFNWDMTKQCAMFSASNGRTDRQTDTQTDRQADKQAGRQTDR